ncbi:hypothetical protein MASR2M64_18300 [Candidatus Cloacimonadota bacterium]
MLLSVGTPTDLASKDAGIPKADIPKAGIPIAGIPTKKPPAVTPGVLGFLAVQNICKQRS